MKFVTRFSGLVLMGMLVASASAQDESAAIKREIGKASGMLGRAIEAKDVATLEKIWAPDFVVNSPENKVLRRSEVFAALKAGELDYGKYETVVESFTVHGDVAIMMGHEDITQVGGAHAGKKLVRRFTNVWQKRTDAWVLLARQSTIVSELEAKAGQ